MKLIIPGSRTMRRRLAGCIKLSVENVSRSMFSHVKDSVLWKLYWLNVLQSWTWTFIQTEVFLANVMVNVKKFLHTEILVIIFLSGASILILLRSVTPFIEKCTHQKKEFRHFTCNLWNSRYIDPLLFKRRSSWEKVTWENFFHEPKENRSEKRSTFRHSQRTTYYNRLLVTWLLWRCHWLCFE